MTGRRRATSRPAVQPAYGRGQRSEHRQPPETTAPDPVCHQRNATHQVDKWNQNRCWDLQKLEGHWWVEWKYQRQFDEVSKRIREKYKLIRLNWKDLENCNKDIQDDFKALLTFRFQTASPQMVSNLIRHCHCHCHCHLLILRSLPLRFQVQNGSKRGGTTPGASGQRQCRRRQLP